MRLLFFLFVLLFSFTGFSQEKISGYIFSNTGEAIKNAHIDLNGNCSTTTEEGFFEVAIPDKNPLTLRVLKEGFESYFDKIATNKKPLEIYLEPLTQENLKEIIIHTTHRKPYNASNFNNRKIQENFSGSLAASLTSLPGVNAMEIGSGASKPIIRGLGLNRVAVTENGIKQEGQQWGADHGLDIDALQTEEVEVIKGVGAIEYGSDAIGGVIRINNEKIPTEEKISGKIILHGKTVNNAIGTSALLQQRKENWFYKIKFSALDYADYKVPTTNIRYLGTNIPIYNQKMKNTAGDQYAFQFQWGFVSNHFQNITTISNVYSKAGFFPGAHGIPNIRAVLDDGNQRDVSFPYQRVNHLKIINNSKWIKDHSLWKFSFGFQQNTRQELSKFHTHYSNQLPPKNNPDVELDFTLNTFDTQLSYEIEPNINFVSTFGIQHNFQDNQIDGYSYLLPKFWRNSIGLFTKNHWDITSKWQLDLGARLDFSKTKIDSFWDNVLYEFLLNNSGKQTAEKYALRTKNIDKTYFQQNISLGSRYQFTESFYTLLTLGSNFRLPTPMELGSNGVHHGAFRHELGNENLNPEKGFSSELKFGYETQGFSLSFNPYLYYFSNYIFLKPTHEFSILPHAGQLYEYSQSKALLSGFELTLYKKWKKLSANASFEYIYNSQLNATSGNYALPFSPPINFYSEIFYTFGKVWFLKGIKASVNMRWANAQKRIAQNEEFTDGYTVFGGSLQGKWQIGKLTPTIHLQIQNIFNKKYFNHTSFYRPVEIPELGRSIQLMISLPF